MASALENIHPDLHPLARPLTELNEDPENANEHSALSREALIAAFTKFGQRKPIVVRKEGMIVEAGNGTLAALRAAGWTHLACVVCDDDEQTARAYAIADNQTARLSEWNFDQLRRSTAELLDADYDMSSLGFSAEALAEISAGANALNESTPTGAQPTPSPSVEPSADIEQLDDADTGTGGSAGAHTLIPHISWGKTRVPMTDEEVAALDLAFKEHVDTFGSPFGFVSSLLDSE